MQRGANGVGGDPLDPDCFERGGVAGDNRDVAATEVEQPGEELGDRVVRPALFGRGGDGDAGSPLPFAHKTGPRRTGDDFYGQEDSAIVFGDLQHVAIVADGK